MTAPWIFFAPPGPESTGPDDFASEARKPGKPGKSGTSGLPASSGNGTGLSSLPRDHLALLKDSLDSLQISLNAAYYNQVGPDWMDRSYTPAFSKFYWIQEGRGRLRVGDSTWEPAPGELCLLPEGMDQGYEYLPPEGFSKYWCHFTVRLAGVSLFDLVQPPWSVQVVPEEAAGIRALFERMIRVADPASGFVEAFDARSALLQLVAFYLRLAGESGLAPRLTASLGTVARAVMYLRKHCHRSLGIAEVAGHLGMHPASFTRLFHQQMGLPPVQYLIQLRLASAASLLGSTELSLAEVALRCGFKDEFYFSRLFHRHYGQSPAAWGQARRNRGT